MKSLLTAALAGLLLFTISAGVSYYLYLNQESPEAEVAEKTDDQLPIPEEIPDDRKVEIMPVSLRPNTPLTVEAVLELAQSIRKKEQALQETQNRVEREEKRIQLLAEDVQREREELSALGQQVEAKLITAREAVERLRLENQKVDQQIKILTSLEKKTGKTTDDLVEDAEAKKIKVAKSWFEKLDADQAANSIKEFANRGDIGLASKLLQSLETRQVNKIIVAIDDPLLVTQLVDAIEDKKVTDQQAALK